MGTKDVKESGGIVIYSVDDDGGVGECDDEDLRLLESMGGGGANKNKAAAKGAKGMFALVVVESKLRSTFIKAAGPIE